MPILTIGLQSYGGEIALHIYLFLLPAACVLGACPFFPDPRAEKTTWRTVEVPALCTALLPTAVLLVRYGNDAFERIPRLSWPPGAEPRPLLASPSTRSYSVIWGSLGW